jgi:hypothetical protein
MAGPITALKLFKTSAFKKYKAEIIRLLKVRPRPKAEDAKDAGILAPDWSIDKLLQAARTLLAQHAARRDNPHQETMESIGSYSETVVAQKLTTKIANSIVPISSFGIVDRLTPTQVLAMWTYPATGWVLNANRAVKVVMSGTTYDLPITALNLAAVSSSPANKTFNIFIRLRFGKVSYEVRDDSPPESTSIMYIGSVTTGANGITSKEFVPVIRIDTFRPGSGPRGSVIPVTIGTLDNPTKFPSNWNPL